MKCTFKDDEMKVFSLELYHLMEFTLITYNTEPPLGQRWPHICNGSQVANSGTPLICMHDVQICMLYATRG